VWRLLPERFAGRHHIETDEELIREAFWGRVLVTRLSNNWVCFSRTAGKTPKHRPSVAESSPDGCLFVT
jgi:hypothetical protein